MSSFLSSLLILDLTLLSGVGLVKIFSHSVDTCFILFTVPFALGKFFSFRRCHLLIIAFSECATGIIFRNWCPVPIHSRLLPTFFSIKFISWNYVEVIDPLGFDICAWP